MDINNDNIMEYNDENYNINLAEIDLISLIKKYYSKTSENFDLTINKNIYNFHVKKLSESEIYKITFSGKSYIIFKKVLIKFQKGNNIIKCSKFQIYEKIIDLVKKYNYLNPYINIKGKKLKINMDINISDQKKLKLLENVISSTDNTILENKLNYILDEESFLENKKIIDKEENFSSDIFGKYFKDYINNINPSQNLIYSINDNSFKFQCYTGYNNYDINFNFITGPEKIGKTFYSLCKNKENGYHIYFNLKTFNELEVKKNYEKMNKIFFHEISKYFKTYKDYKEFSEDFFQDNIDTFISSYKFQNLFLQFLESIEKYMKEKSEIYPQLMILLDEVELNTELEEIFNTNYGLVNEIYNKIGSATSPIHFSIISPINDNYIKRCVRLGLELFYKRANEEFEIDEKDNITGITYYAYTYIPSLFYSNENEFEDYKSKVKERNIKKIPDKYLSSFNYSLYHLFNLEKIYNNEIDQEKKIQEIDNYIKKMEKEGDKIALSYYEDENKIYKYDLDKLKNYNNLIGKEINLYQLMDLLSFFPIRLIKFNCKIFREIFKVEERYKFIVEYTYPIYKNTIFKYINEFNKPDYNENTKYKPGQKGDLLEEKVIDSFKAGYFKNFTPDYFIEVNSIIDLHKNNNSEDKNKFLNVDKYNLIMITQSNAYARKYDLAFLNKIDDNNYKFILSQISRKKEEKQMKKYLTTKYDCYNLADFFNEININVTQYHFIFIFQAGLEEDTQSMEFCKNNGIKYLKYCTKGKKPIFSNSSNTKIESLIFDDKSYSLVNLINSDEEYNISDDENSENSLIGQKRQKIDNFSKTIYFFGNTIYNKIRDIIELDFEISDDYYSLEENKYFYVYYKNGKKEFYLKYLSKGKEKIVNVMKENENETEDIEQESDQSKLKKLINSPGFKFKCLLMNYKNKKEKNF